MRERRVRFGELVQIDGSPHDWFEGRGSYCTLLVFIDDASGKLTQLRFMPTETTLGYMRVLHDHLLAHGVPAALYRDKNSIFRINAHSQQENGRVERANQTLQDRLVKEMRLAGIDDMDSANAWLPGYIADYNRRFAVVPKDPTDAHFAYPDTPAALWKNLSCQHENWLLQVFTSATGLG